MSAGKSGRIFYLVAGFMGGVLLAGHFLRHTLSALLTSLVIAYFLNPFLKYLEKRGIGRLLAIVVIYLYAFVLFIALSLFLVPYLNSQLESLPRAIPGYLNSMQRAMLEWQVRMTPYYRGAEGAWLIARGEEALARLAAEVSGRGYERLTAAVYGMLNLALAPILVFFILCYKELFKDMLLRFTPHRERREFREFGRRVNRALERFVLAQFFDCLLMGGLSALALMALGIKFPLLNGFLAGFASAVPFLGVMLAAIPPAFIGYADTGDLSIIPKVCAVYFLIYVVIEGNLVKPLLMRGTLKLNPLAVIFALMAMGELMGFWGVVLAVPVAAVVKIAGAEAHDLFIEEEHHEEGHL